MTNQHIISATQKWLTSFIIEYNICPFAQREQQRNSIRYRVASSGRLESALETLIEECVYLDEQTDTETTLFILPKGFSDFEDYLDMLAMAEQLLLLQGYEGVYQLASFHPNYRFEDNGNDTEIDPANYTNRSPYPMLHIIREESLERALSHYPDPENIPVRNIKLAREMGLNNLQQILAACYK
jgi:hypothetical protein